MIFLSVIIPVYNNSNVLKNNLPYLCNYLSKKDFEYEIIIVDDGSKNSRDVEEISKDYNGIYIMSQKNIGKGNAVKKGMLSANGNYRIYTDADIPYENEDIDKIIHSLDKEKYDIIIGDRTLNKSSYYKNVTFLRSFGSKLFSLIVGGVTSGKFEDTQCGLKGFTSEVAVNLFEKSRINGFAIDVELLYLALKMNYKIGKIPVQLRKQGLSTVKIIKHGFFMLVDLIKIKIYQIKNKYE
ncbi:MAG: glycosyltransferase [Ignavibacteria bacterium]